MKKTNKAFETFLEGIKLFKMLRIVNDYFKAENDGDDANAQRLYDEAKELEKTMTKYDINTLLKLYGMEA